MNKFTLNMRDMKTLKLNILALLALFFVAGCSQAPEGETTEVSAAEEVEEVSASATDFAINTDQSEITWFGFKPTGRHQGTIGIQDGSIAVENGSIVGGTIKMDMNNIVVTDEDLPEEQKQKLTGHLKSPDFFAVEQYPTAEFVITNVEEYQSGAVASSEEEDDNMAVVVNNEEVSEYKTENPTHLITGNLTMRDTTLSITFPANLNISDNQVSANAKFNIDRTKWNVNFRQEATLASRAKDELIYDTVNVGFDIVAAKQEQPQAEVTSATNEEDS